MIMKYLVWVLLFLPLYSLSQVCATADTVRSNATSFITYNSARVNGTVAHFTAAPVSLQLRYVRVGFTDTATATTSPTTALRNLTGLQAATQYVYYYKTICGSGTASQNIGAYKFTTLASTITYAGEGSTTFPYIKADSGLKAPRADTSRYRAPNTNGGDIVFKTSDSTFYGWRGNRWISLGVDSAGILPLLNRKVDSVTVAGDSLFYWINSVAYGYVLPGTALTWQDVLTNGSVLTGNTVDGDNTSFVWNDMDYFTVNTTNGFTTQNTTGGVVNTINNSSGSNYINVSSVKSSTGAESIIKVYPDSIRFEPAAGVLTIDTLNYQSNANDSMLVWRPTTGRVGMRAIPTATGTGTVTGSGTINFLPKWSSSTSLTNALFFDDGTTQSIGGSTNKLAIFTGTATGLASVGIGLGSAASGAGSLAGGGINNAYGTGSFAWGTGIKSKAYNGVVIGTYNDSTDATSETAYNVANRVFQIGIGTADAARANAMTVLQGGNVGIGNTAPLENLSILASAPVLGLHSVSPAGITTIKFNDATTTTFGSISMNGNTGEMRYFTAGSYFPTFYSSGAEVIRINTSGNTGIGTGSTISAKLHTISTTEQLRVGYDASNYYSTTVGSTGGVTLDAIGAGAGFTFSDPITNTSSALTTPIATTSLTTGSSTFGLLNTTATTVNAFGATTALNIGASAATILNFGGHTTAAKFRYLEPSASGTNYSEFSAVAQAANLAYTWPPAFVAGGVLTDVSGNGTLTWAAAGGSSLFPTTGTGTATGNVVGNVATNRVDIISTAYPDGLFFASNSGETGIGDYAFAVSGTSIIVRQASSQIEYTATSGHTFTGPITMSVLAGTGSRSVLADASGVLSAPVSDFTTKQNIHSLTIGTDILMQLKPVTFEYRPEFQNYGKGQQVGFIAQDIQKILPNSTYINFSNNKMGYNSSDLIPILVSNAQSQQKEIEQLKKEVDELKLLLKK